MLSHKLVIDDVEEDYHLLAIHSSLEEYKLAFYLNRQLQICLKRARIDVDFNHGNIQALYPLYTFKEPEKYRTYNLIKNKFKGPVKKVVSSGSLFVEEEVSPQVTYLIPEYKEVDYFLKIDDENGEDIQIMVAKLASIPNVQTTYEVDPNQLKSKSNLILE
ncbi:IPExxxVDY family protein [Antarcticibacterium sp. 1MA-6-2]|uniref:IPExxxVDY family protein n=1 Tax=Antarcticibacterium sp. 1MA-6-2 TaxID=2908210 RepID=UPI001F2C52AF|nr:IPExxxVDY family protein [Antarcticibacterium sp. 1MA-6-2]UJH90029.1 IPExxxVDY family protein [Antarcticibacterium sp. 1MA-6-2]